MAWLLQLICCCCGCVGGCNCDIGNECGDWWLVGCGDGGS